MPINLSGIQLEDPKKLFSECYEKSLPTTPWYGAVNSFRSPVGRGMGTADLLLRKSQYSKFSSLDSNNLTLTFTDERGGSSITFRRLKFLSSTNVLPGDMTASVSVLMLKLGDRRSALMQVPVARRYNWRYSDGTFDASSLNGGVAFSWSQLVANIWAKMVAVYSSLPVTAPTFPTPPASVPEGFDFIDEDCWTGLCRVVQAAGYLVKYDPTTDVTTIIDPATAAPTETDAAKRTKNWDAASRIMPYGKNPESIRVSFPRTNRSDDYAITTTNPSAFGAVAGTVGFAFSDLPVVGEPPLNFSQVSARAIALTAQAGRDALESAQPRRPVEYHGYQDWARLAVGYSNYSEWAVYDRGNGLKTALTSGPLLVDQRFIPLDLKTAASGSTSGSDGSGGSGGSGSAGSGSTGSGGSGGSGGGSSSGPTIEVLTDTCFTFCGSGSGSGSCGPQITGGTKQFTTYNLLTGVVVSTRCVPILDCSVAALCASSSSSSGSTGSGGSGGGGGAITPCCPGVTIPGNITGTLSAKTGVAVGLPATITISDTAFGGLPGGGAWAYVTDPAFCGGFGREFVMACNTSTNLWQMASGASYFTGVVRPGATCSPLAIVFDMTVSFVCGGGGTFVLTITL